MFIIACEYPYGLTIYVRWDAKGSGSYWAWTDELSKAERFDSIESIRFSSALEAATKERSPISIIEVS